jgi:hypothetical protein
MPSISSLIKLFTTRGLAMVCMARPGDRFGSSSSSITSERSFPILAVSLEAALCDRSSRNSDADGELQTRIQELSRALGTGGLRTHSTPEYRQSGPRKDV